MSSYVISEFSIKVKRQAVIEIQRAVAAAESRALELIATERLKMEKMFMDFNRSNAESSEAERQSPQAQGTQNVSNLNLF